MSHNQMPVIPAGSTSAPTCLNHSSQAHSLWENVHYFINYFKHT